MGCDILLVRKCSLNLKFFKVKRDIMLLHFAFHMLLFIPLRKINLKLDIEQTILLWPNIYYICCSSPTAYLKIKSAMLFLYLIS